MAGPELLLVVVFERAADGLMALVDTNIAELAVVAAAVAGSRNIVEVEEPLGQLVLSAADNLVGTLAGHIAADNAEEGILDDAQEEDILGLAVAFGLVSLDILEELAVAGDDQDGVDNIQDLVDGQLE